MIKLHLSEGFGNNIFQALFAEYISSLTGHDIQVSGVTSPVSELYTSSAPSNDVVKITDRNFDRTQRDFFDLVTFCQAELKKHNVIYLSGNFEYFELFELLSPQDTRLKIFTINQSADDSVRIHARMNNRLVQANHGLNWVCPHALLARVREEHPERSIEIISDYDLSVSAENIDKSLSDLRSACREGPNAGAFLLPNRISREYVLAWKEAIDRFDVKLKPNKKNELRRSSGALNNNFLDDFYILQQSYALYFWGSTFSYLAFKFSQNNVQAYILSPWKNDKNDKGPYLDKDKAAHNLLFANMQYKPKNINNLFMLKAYSALPYAFRHYSQAVLSRFLSMTKASRKI